METVKNKIADESTEFTQYLLALKNNENMFAKRFSKELIQGRIAQISLCNWVSLSA